MAKDVYPGLAWINGERPGDQRNDDAVQSCEREPWTLPEWAAVSVLCNTASCRDIRVQFK